MHLASFFLNLMLSSKLVKFDFWAKTWESKEIRITFVIANGNLKNFVLSKFWLFFDDILSQLKLKKKKRL